MGVLPFSRFWASNKPFGAPLAGLALQWLMCVIVILAPPPGDAYDFILNRECPSVLLLPSLVPRELTSVYRFHIYSRLLPTRDHQRVHFRGTPRALHSPRSPTRLHLGPTIPRVFPCRRVLFPVEPLPRVCATRPSSARTERVRRAAVLVACRCRCGHICSRSGVLGILGASIAERWKV